MAEVYAYDGTPLTIVKDGSVEIVESADHGNIGASRLTLDDAAGTQAIVGHKSFVVTQSASSNSRIFTGYVAQRSYHRGEAPKVQASREIDVDLIDLNARLGFKVIRGRTGRRPSETINARMAWLLASSFLSGLVVSGTVTSNTRVLDKNDYRGQFPADVLRDMALEVGYNYFVYWDDTVGASLWFADSNSSTALSSTLRISNVLSDIDESTTFAAGADAELSRDPSEVVSGLFKPYKNGRVYRTRTATASNFEPRDGVGPASDVKTRARAIVRADRELFARRNEEDLVTDTIVLPDDKVNLVRAGQRIQAKYSHFTVEGYGGFTWFRILETSKKPRNADAGEYDVGLKLSPQEEAQVVCASDGTIIQQADGHGASGVTLPSPVTVGSTLVAFVWVRGLTPYGLDLDASTPDTEWTTLWSGSDPNYGSSEHMSLTVLMKTATTTNDHWFCGGAVGTSVADWIFMYELPGGVSLGVTALSECCWGTHNPGAINPTTTNDVLLYGLGKTNLHGPHAYPTPAGSWTQDWHLSMGDGGEFGIPPYVEQFHKVGTGSSVPTNFTDTNNGYEDAWYIAVAVRVGCT